jgi:hypothetical protein
MRKPSPSMLVALVALFVALGGVGIAANGGNLILGQSNHATAQTSLSAPVAGGKTLSLANNDTSKSNSTALGLAVSSGHPPFSVNSSTRVANLNADRLDGLDASAFVLGQNQVRMEAQLTPGQTKFWDIGPYIRLTGDCTSNSGQTVFHQNLLNDSPGTGSFQVGAMTYNNGNDFLVMPAVRQYSGTAITITRQENPVTSAETGTFDEVTLVWSDPSGETITGIFSALASTFPGECDLHGTLTRAT